jgi:deferrochelatase/peroxidase EfeB
MVYRQLQQDVAGFWKFVDGLVGGDAQARDRLAAKFVGRWRSGTPLVVAPDHDTWTDPKKLNRFNDFDYSEDLEGYKCPIGSHVRRSNPRDSLGPDHDTAIRTTNRHRIMRRGRSYGDRLSRTDPMPMVDDKKERGLHFICFNTDIERQFEFVQQTWINNAQFGGLHDEVDPMVGDQSAGSKMMTVQGDPLRERYKNMQSFVTMRGGVYAFLPSIRALRWIAAV